MKVIISEDHVLYREGLRGLIQQLDPGAQVMESGDLSVTKKLLLQHPDTSLLLFDICVPGSEGLSGLRQIKKDHPLVLLIVISTLDYQVSIQQMMRLGADGFIAKTTSREAMFKGLQAALKGEIVIISEQENQLPMDFSPRQIAALEFLSKGLTNKEIANAMGISATTVRDYLSIIMKKLKVKNRTEAIAKARELGILIDMNGS